jgi:8-oxo-dGTP pyrophosphatase MutT (NUDIX family)
VTTPQQRVALSVRAVDRRADRVLLCDHRLAGLWLPTGGHVEPGEDPVDTVRREAMEELGVSAAFDALTGAEPFFLTVTPTVGDAVSRHVDVSLWFALEARVGAALRPDAAEFAGLLRSRSSRRSVRSADRWAVRRY